MDRGAPTDSGPLFVTAIGPSKYGPDPKERPMNSLSRPRDTKTALDGWQPDHETMLRQAAERAMEFRRALDGRPQRSAKSFAEMRESFLEPLPEEGSDGRFVLE